MNGVKSGDTGPSVELVQLALKRAGQDYLNADGVFGRKTLEALMDFQKNSKLKVCPAADQDTRRALTPFLTGFLRHRMCPGDTPYTLALRYGTTQEAILGANPGHKESSGMEGSLKIPLHFDVIPTGIHFSSRILGLSLSGLLARYPFLHAHSIGQSVMGKTISCITMGTGKNHVFYNASHHGNEWITTAVLMKFLENYAKAFSRDGEIGGISARHIFETATLHMTPMVNPDGVDLATGTITSGAFFDRAREISENYPDIPFPKGWKANIRGVDLNLQYPAGWENAKKNKFSQGYNSPAPRDYVGAAPLSEPESISVCRYTQMHDFCLTASYHSQGQVIYWKYLDFLPPNSHTIALAFTRLSGYTAEETPTASGYAGYKDWFIQSFDRPGYTIEVGHGENPLPITQFDEIYGDNEAMLALGCIAASL